MISNSDKQSKYFEKTNSDKSEKVCCESFQLIAPAS